MQDEKLIKKCQNLETENTNLKTENTSLKTENTSLKVENENLQLQLQNLKKMIFGSKRERTPNQEESANKEQISLFPPKSEEEQNEQVQEEQKQQIEDITVHEKKGRKKKENIAGIKKRNLKDVEIVKYEHVLDDTENKCPKCNSELEVIGKKVIREEIVYVPAKLEIHTIVQYVYKCKNCGKKDSENETPTIVKAQIPKPLLTHSFISCSLATEVLYQKYYMGVPFYRQEKVWDDRGLVLPRNMMAKWAIKINEYYFESLYNLMFKKLKENNKVGHSDETTIQCNKEAGRKASSNSYMCPEFKKNFKVWYLDMKKIEVETQQKIS